MVADPVSGDNDGKGGDDGNEEVKSDCQREGKVLHSGKWPGHKNGRRGERGDIFYRLEKPPTGSPMMFPMASSSKSSQMGYPSSGSRKWVVEVLGQWWRVWPGVQLLQLSHT